MAHRPPSPQQCTSDNSKMRAEGAVMAAGGANGEATRTAAERLSVNQWTVRSWGVRELVDGCGRHGIGAVGLWREPVADFGLARSAKVVRDAGLRVSSL